MRYAGLIVVTCLAAIMLAMAFDSARLARHRAIAFKSAALCWDQNAEFRRTGGFR